VRQFCYLSHKIERECTDARIEAAFSQFVRTDEELVGLPGRISPERLITFKRTANRLFGDMFSRLETIVANFDLIPKHGPGAVAERKSQKDRRSYDYWTQRLEGVFPRWRYTSNACPPSFGTELVPVEDEIPVRVISVPKTQATPRIIAIEPSAMQYAQQGLKREIYEYVGRGPLSGIMGFQDQERNQVLAQAASIQGHLGTLDLSEASDRVHWFLVRSMLERWPHLWDYVWATRSHRAQVPGWGVIPLQKFASMGSALTFPLEAMVFTTLALCGMEDGLKKRFTVRELPGQLSVYGDDIIVPVDAIDHVVDWLEHFGAKVNRTKSFWKGNFRESCGAEYYRGIDVSVVRLRHELPSSRDDAANIAALVDFRNRAYRAGLWSLVSDVDEGLESLIRLPRSRVTQEDADAGYLDKTGYLSKQTFLPVTLKHVRYNPHLHRYERRVPVLKSFGANYTIDDEAGLLEWFYRSLRQADLLDRYDSQERPTSFSIERRWVEVEDHFYG
jgi:hypothetical protein